MALRECTLLCIADQRSMDSTASLVTVGRTLNDRPSAAHQGAHAILLKAKITGVQA